MRARKVVRPTVGATVATDDRNEALPVAEETFQRDFSDEKGLNLYLPVSECGLACHTKVSDEIGQALGDGVVRRMEAGDPSPVLCHYVPASHYPGQNKKSFRALLKGNLPHRNQRLFEYEWGARTSDIDGAIADLSRGQSLGRIRPPIPESSTCYAWQDCSRSELIRRVLAHDCPSNTSGMGG